MLVVDAILTYTIIVRPPSSEEFASDVTDLAQSAKSLVTLLLTSSAFRILVSSLFATSRQVIASAASSVGAVAERVEIGAAEVRKAAQLDDVTFEGVVGRVSGAVGDTLSEGAAAAHVPNEGIDKVRDEVVGRVQEVCLSKFLNRYIIITKSRP